MMEVDRNIVERLRRMADMTTTGNDLSDISRAADEIEILRAEIKELRAALARANDLDPTWQPPHLR